MGLLGVLPMYARIKLVMNSWERKLKSESFILLVCTIVLLVGSSVLFGFCCGITVHLLLKLRDVSRDTPL